MDELRYLSQPSLRSDTQNNSQINPLLSPPRNGPRLQPAGPITQNDPRISLSRRFTTESGRVPTLSSHGTGSTTRAAQLPPDYPTTLQIQKVQLIEKKKQDYDRLREQKRRFELEMQKLDQQQRNQEQEIALMQEDLSYSSSHQSEPTTPPEFSESSTGFPSLFSRPNRYSTSSLSIPPGVFGPPGRSASQIASPQANHLRPPSFSLDDEVPLQSLSSSRRGSDEDEKEQAVRQDPTSHRSTNHLNRYSMPVTRSRKGLYDAASLDQTNTTRFLFGDEENGSAENQYPQVNSLQDTFASLIRSDSMSLSSLNGIASSGPTSEIASIGSRPSSIRKSLELKYLADSIPDTQASIAAPGNHLMATPPKLQSSYSTNDIPTAKNSGGVSIIGINANNHAQQYLHHHNASIGRIPAGAVAPRHSRELSADSHISPSLGRDQAGFPSLGTALQANAPSFGASPTVPIAQSLSQNNPNTGLGHYGGAFYPAGYTGAISSNGSGFPGVPFLNLNMGNLNLGNNYAQSFSNGFGSAYHTPSPPQHSNNMADSQARVIQSRRIQDNEQMNKYHNLPLSSVIGQIYDLCKDQHGCRYLQRKLEERDSKNIHLIWAETCEHVIELMTDPFGNYLCQKLLEYCDDTERTALINMASGDMVRIALNQHGTRALQKMIEFVSTPQQIQLIIGALRHNVVELIQDLNGNHVVQKCLSKLSHHDSAFIFEAVGNNCVEVGTHRHGCCVLQRCIDHAFGDQKSWLVQRVTESAIQLVEDPFGNYVVQYIIDLNDPAFTEPLVAMFQGRIVVLSRHKFSSNVIEKCLRCSQDPSKDMIVSELLSYPDTERLLRDSYANYVVQTALDYAAPSLRYRLVESVRPHLPSIRTTPYGRRIQTKVQLYDNQPATTGAAPGAVSSSVTSAVSQGVNSDGSHGQLHHAAVAQRMPKSAISVYAGGHVPAVSAMPANSVIVPTAEFVEPHIRHTLPPPVGAHLSQLSMQPSGPDASRVAWI